MPAWNTGALHLVVEEVGQRERWVFPSGGSAIRQLTERIREPARLVKVCASEQETRPFLAKGWDTGTPRFFMTAEITQTRSSDVSGVEIALSAEPWGIRATASDGNGEVAGRAGLLTEGDVAVIDRLVVEDAWRGRGVGTALAAKLMNAAAVQGATRGRLVATVAGRPLYEWLGWTVVSDYTTAEFRR